MAKKYENSFYSSRHANSSYSANRIIELVKDLVNPSSVVDVGCGVGTWLKAFYDSGVKNIHGIEGKWVDESNLVIPNEYFQKENLENSIHLERKFDLAMSLEVAEHIHEQFADVFVKNLTDLAPVVLFSAAIPLQAGKHHVNEQWPEYWQDKFAQHGYLIIDCIRPEVWTDEKVEMWYAQNTFIYVREEELNNYPQLAAKFEKHPKMLAAVLPRFYEHKLRTWPIMKAIRNRVQRALN